MRVQLSYYIFFFRWPDDEDAHHPLPQQGPLHSLGQPGQRAGHGTRRRVSYQMGRQNRQSGEALP